MDRRVSLNILEKGKPLPLTRIHTADYPAHSLIAMLIQWVRETVSRGGDSMNLDHSVTAYDDSLSGYLQICVCDTQGSIHIINFD